MRNSLFLKVIIMSFVIGIICKTNSFGASITGLNTSYCQNSPNDTIYSIKGANGIPGSGNFDVSGFATIVGFLGDSGIVIDINNFGTGPVEIRYDYVANQCPPGNCNMEFTLYANSVVALPIAISQHPINQNSCPGTATDFSITTSEPVLSYQWQIDPNLGAFSNLVNGLSVFGATASNLSIMATNYLMNGYQYRCIVTGLCGTAISSSAILSIEASPSISLQPSHQTVCEGTPTSFTVSASETNAYQWQLFDGSNWTNLSNNSTYSNVSSATLSVSSVNSSMDNNLYRCMLTGDCAQTLTSEIAVLHVTSTCVEFSGLNSKYCLNDDVSALNGFPSGGVFSGPGISMDGMNQYWFDADAIGSPGIKNISYDLTFAGCTFSKTLQTEVKDDCEIVPNDPLPLAPEANKKEREKDVKLIELYPNPTKVSARILNPTGIDITKVLLLDAKGNVVWEGLPEANEISLTGLSKGLYSVLLYSTDEVWKEKLVLE